MLLTQQEILVVEDDESHRFIFVNLLKPLGFAVTALPDGQSAVEYLSGHTPSVILLDMLLPRLPGEAVLAYIYAQPHLAHSRVFVITAHEHFRSLTLRPGDRFFLKPVQNQLLRQAIQSALALAS